MFFKKQIAQLNSLESMPKKSVLTLTKRLRSIRIELCVLWPFSESRPKNQRSCSTHTMMWFLVTKYITFWDYNCSFLFSNKRKILVYIRNTGNAIRLKPRSMIMVILLLEAFKIWNRLAFCKESLWVFYSKKTYFGIFLFYLFIFN